MSTQDPTQDTTLAFDVAAAAASLTADTAPHFAGNGHVAIVIESDPNDRRRRKAKIFDSHQAHFDAGVFAEREQAQRYAEAWREAKIAQLAREHALRVIRGVALGRKLRELAQQEAGLVDAKAAIATQIKVVGDTRTKLIAEANDPRVEIDLDPRSERWRIYDSPSVSDGTAERNHRQLVLEGTGLEPIRPAAQGPTSAAESTASDAWPKGVTDRKGKAIRRGSWVRVLDPVQTWIGQVVGAASETLVHVAAPGQPHVEVATSEIERATKPKDDGGEALQGRDPGQVRWPEDDGVV